MATVAREHESGQADDAAEEDESSGSSPIAAFLPRLLFAGAVLAYIVLLDPDPALAMALIGFTGVLMIVSDARFGFEQWLEVRSLPSREAWVPALVVTALLGFGYVTTSESLHVVAKTIDVIAFILAFALVAEGLGRCGFFQFLAFRITERCHGNTTRLILYLFLLTSILTYFTSNDIVILTMTPIVMAVAYHSRMRNATLLLLSQFVAANTVSMGLLIGSPTNLILGRATGLNFVEYFFLMLIPTLLSLLITFVVITKIHELIGKRSWSDKSRIGRWFSEWEHAPSYATPQFAEYRTLTTEMHRWLKVFASSVLVLAVITAMEWSLFWAAVPIAAVALFFLAREELDHSPAARMRAVARPLRGLPLGIVFFGLAFFILASALGQTDFVQDEAVPALQDLSSQQTPVASWAAIASSGATVNIINDLPASALAGEVYSQASFDDPSDKALMLQGTLVGLNTGTYVTPIGALAGLIWFDILRRERRRFARGGGGVPRHIRTPTRRDMVLYGGMTFVATGTVLGAANFGYISLVSVLLGPIESTGHFNPDGGRAAVAVLCGSLLILIPLAFRRLLIRHDVVLSHMADVFVVLTRFRVMASRHRLAFSACIAALIFVSAGTLLYWAESFHATTYGEEAPFNSIGGFITWLIVFIGSGFENDRFPNSVLGALLAALLALGSIAVVIFLVKVSSSETNESLRMKIARGIIPTDRLVIFHASDERVGLARAVLRRPGRFVVAIGEANDSRDLRLALDVDHRDRAAFVDHQQSMSALVRDYDLPSVREIIMMSASKADDFENLSLLLEIDRLGYLPEDPIVGTPQSHLPRVLVECAMPDMQQLLSQSLSEVFLARIRTIQLSDRFGEYLLAENHRDPSLLAAYYGSGPSITQAQGDEQVSIRMDHRHQLVDVTLAEPIDLFADTGTGAGTGDRRHPWLLRQSAAQHLREKLIGLGHGQAPIMGVVVRAGERLERLSLVAYSAVGARGDIHGITILQSADPSPAPGAEPTTTELRDLIVVSATSLAEQTVTSLLDGGAQQITYLVHEHAQVPPELSAHPELTVREVDSEAMASSVIITEFEPETRILLFDDLDDRLLSTERLLEHLSSWRISMQRRGQTPPTLIVQCLGEARREHLRRFVSDEIIDSSWIDRSFFEILARVYLDLISVDATSSEGAFRTAGSIASYLAAFEVHETRGLELQGPMTSPMPVVGRTLAEIAELGTCALELEGPVMGLARIEIEHGTVHLRMISPLEDVIVEPDDLLLIVPHI